MNLLRLGCGTWKSTLQSTAVNLRLAAITVLGLVAFVSIVYRYLNLVSEAIQALKELMRWLLRK